MSKLKLVGEPTPLQEFLDVLFKHKQPESIIYTGPKKTKLMTLDEIGELQQSKHDRKNIALYMANGSFTPDAKDGKVFKRQGAFIDEYHYVGLDDIIGKYDDPKLAIEPTSVIESSEENYQFVYALDRGYPAEEYHEFQMRLKKADISDKGACGLNKLFRIPTGINGKDGNKFHVGLNEWNPDKQYSLDELAEAMSLPELTEEDKKFVKFLGDENPATPEQIEKLPILATLQERVNIIKIEEGKIHILCPNHKKHTSPNNEKDSTLLVRENGSYSYSCFHDHCVDDFDFDVWHAGLLYADLRPLIENLPVVTGGIFAQPENGISCDVADLNRDMLIARIIIMRGGKGGFYDLANNNPMTAEMLNNTYGHLMLPTKAKTPVQALKLSAHKQLADGLGWLPIDAPLIELDRQTLINTYRPILLTPIEGDVSRWLKLMTHIYGEHADLVIDHMAFTVQHPERKIKWGVIVIGPQRTGKSLTVRPLVKIFGNAGEIITPTAIKAGWDDIYAEKKVLCYEELYMPGDKGFFNSFKLRLGNDDVETLNRKKRSSIKQQNVASIYGFSNHDNAVHAEEREHEKMLVLAGPNGKVYGEGAKSDQFYKAVFDGIDFGEMTNHIYHFLLQRDVSGFSQGRNPAERTGMFGEMVAHSKPAWLQTLEERIGDVQPSVGSERICDLMTPAELHEYVKRNISNWVTLPGMIAEMKKNKYLRIPEKDRFKLSGNQYSFYVLRDRLGYEDMEKEDLVKNWSAKTCSV